MTVSSLNSANSVIIVGAGMAGLSAALRLKELGIHSLVIEKSRGVGGRLATRRMKVGEKTAYLDHGAQFFTVRSSEFGAWLKPLQETHSVQNWFAAQKDSHPRWCGDPGHGRSGQNDAGPIVGRGFIHARRAGRFDPAGREVGSRM